MREFDSAEQLALLLAAYERIERLRHEPYRDARCESVSAWSVGQHLAHVALANELGARNVRSLIEGSGLFVVDAGEPVPAAAAVLESGVFPRGQVGAPRMVRPPEAVDAGLLSLWIEESRLGFEALALEHARIAQASKRVPHQLMGPLSARQWLRFAAIHSHHHASIAEEVVAGARA